jgi:hypothetical protein
MPTFFTDLNSGMMLPFPKFTTRAMSSSTANAHDLSGSGVVILNNSGATPGTFTPRTAAQMVADDNLIAGQQYIVLLSNGQATGTLTLGTATGFTISGTTTVATNTVRIYTVTVTNSTLGSEALVFTSVGSFTATAFAFGA